MEDIKKYWNEFLDIINEDDEFAAVALLKGSAFIVDNENNVIIACSGDFAASHIKKIFLNRIKEFLKDKSGNDINIDVIVDSQLVRNNIPEENIEEDIETNTNKKKEEIIKYKTNLNEYYIFYNFIKFLHCD